MNITTKMAVYTTCILAMVLGVLLAMNYFKYGNILTEVTASRLAVINKNIEFSLTNRLLGQMTFRGHVLR